MSLQAKERKEVANVVAASVFQTMYFCLKRELTYEQKAALLRQARKVAVKEVGQGWKV
ncbi:hypothetical protein AB4262_10745 [Vibrio breoganii]